MTTSIKNKKAVKLPLITEDLAKQVWMLTTLEDKRLVLEDWIGANCNTDDEAKIRLNIRNATTPEKLDVIVTNMYLKAYSLGTIK